MHVFSFALLQMSLPLPDPFVETIPGTLVTFRMRAVPAGEVVIDGVKHSVPSLWVAETETTWDAYDVYAYRLDLSQEDQAAGVDAESRPSKPYGAVDRGFGHRGYPALAMTHHAARGFCAWLAAKTDKPYRLPTEAEWVHASLAGVADPTDLDAHAWFWDNADDKTQPVGKKRPNAWGLHDTLGNVMEWVDGPSGPLALGGSWRDKGPQVGSRSRTVQPDDWTMSDPQNPKSRWWLSDGPVVGFRIVLPR